MFRQILILSAIVFLIAILSIHAEVTFIPDAEIALPDSFFIDDNTTFEFKDLNNDYVEEIIIESEDPLVFIKEFPFVLRGSAVKPSFMNGHW